MAEGATKSSHAAKVAGVACASRDLQRRVCPECGAEAGEQPFCGRCGRNLAQDQRLPSRGEWEHTHQDAAAADAESVRRRSRQRRRIVALIGVALAIVVVLVGGVLVAHHSVRTIRYGNRSMEPTIKVGARVSFEQSRSGPLSIGEVVLFHPPKGAPQAVCDGHLVESGGAGCTKVGGSPTSLLFVQRVVATPGDTVAIREGHVILNGHRQAGSYTAPCGSNSECNFPTPIKVPAGSYYLLGDNRGKSDDSRFYGPIPRGWIVGVAVHCSFFDVFCSDAYTG